MKRADLLATLDIGASIKKLREEKGLSQEELAKDICDRTNITKLENGHYKIPSLSFILLICERLEITINDFLNYAMSNNYSLDRRYILDLLLAHDLSSLKEELDKINIESLSNIDQKYYIFLLAKIAIDNDDLKLAKQYLDSLFNTSKYLPSNFIELLSIHLLNKYKLTPISKQLIYSIYSRKYLLSLLNKNTAMEYLYFINDLLQISINENNKDDAKFLLELEIRFINSHDCYKYLPHYYQNKLEIYNENQLLTKELQNKLFAIQTNNKKLI